MNTSLLYCRTVTVITVGTFIKAHSLAVTSKGRQDVRHFYLEMTAFT